MPREKRQPASQVIFCAATVRRMLMKFQVAPSSRTLRSSAGHFAFRAAHHAGDGERPGGVAHQHGEIIQAVLDAVQGGQLLAGCGRAGDDGGRLAAGALDQHIVVEGVQRLADFQHDVVGGVHDAVDRAHPGQAQAPLDPVRALGDGHIPDQPSTKRGFSSGLRDLDRDLPGNGRP